ncbi:MAG TPA: hypothetical protein VG733_18085, partial [Chthoniobacteraceae bacterium]|nr:hypothetical protein [Chthoniobacteraceae bacterium]
MSKRIWGVIYFLCVAGFLVLVANFYRPGYGFTGLIEFGDQFDTTNIAGLHCLVEPGSAGYDGQFYAKLSLDPLLVNPAKASTGIDAPYYRARRIFLSWSAWALGLGHPAWIVQVYALQNVACWLALAWLLTRWFPPLDFNNFARWAGILFSFGLMHSVRASLTDGPALLLVATALVLYEKKKETLASVVLAVAGLMRETSLLGFAALADPAKRTPRDAARLVLRSVLVAAPLACWIIYLQLRLGNSHNAAGVGNFGVPFVAWAQKWASVLPLLGKVHWGWRVVAIQLALTVQAFYFFLHPQPSKPAWRIGAVFAALMFCLGSAVWGGIPGATGRAVLPMLLAFNLVVPRGSRWWMVLLVAGNLSV